MTPPYPYQSKPPLSDLPLLLTIRPSLSLPDLHLDVPSPNTTPVARLKQQIRDRLGPLYATRKIRLIYQGRMLPDASVLGSVVRAPAPPPLASHGDSKHRIEDDEHEDDGHGEDEDEEEEDEEHDQDARLLSSSKNAKPKRGTVPNKTIGSKPSQKPPHKPSISSKTKSKGKTPLPPALRVYINASIGDPLSRAELEAEAKVAKPPVAPSKSVAPSTKTTESSSHASSHRQSTTHPHSTTASGSTQPTSQPSPLPPAPRGFDRLLNTGFTRPEVSALRLQFRSIQASRHTRDTMPSPDTLRSLEDAWIDTNAFSSSTSTHSGAWGGGEGGSSDTLGGGDGLGGQGGGEIPGPALDDEDNRSILDVVIVAMAIGFFWPLGTVAWLARQDGLWSRKWRLIALLGFLSSLMIGVVKGLAGDG